MGKLGDESHTECNASRWHRSVVTSSTRLLVLFLECRISTLMCELAAVRDIERYVSSTLGPEDSVQLSATSRVSADQDATVPGRNGCLAGNLL
jgi:hypothetical protein